VVEADLVAFIGREPVGEDAGPDAGDICGCGLAMDEVRLVTYRVAVVKLWQERKGPSQYLGILGCRYVYQNVGYSWSG
jgi:hypothetical protein